MKLLKLKIGEIPKEKQFRSLHSGFEIEFHSLEEKGILAMQTFSPFCFAGLNGTGKSNVIEALAAIFFHLECCVAKYKPQNFNKHFKSNECNPDAYTLEYLIGQNNSKPYIFENFSKIIITKEKDKAPKMFRQAYPFTAKEDLIPVSLNPTTDIDQPKSAEGKIYLPEIIIGYSSGENEILSLPFRKSRLLNYDKYREDYLRNQKYEEPENSLIYIDSEMSQAVLLACLLYEDEKTLAPLKEEVGIIGLRSFRMNINMHNVPNFDDNDALIPVIEHINDKIEVLKKCATSWFEKINVNKSINDNLNSTLMLDYYVNDSTKKAFREYFKTAFDLFRFLQVLYELNANTISESIKEEAYKSKGLHTDGKLPHGSPRENVFYFLDFLFLKNVPGEPKPKELLLREFSDGEHQLLHAMGICLMLKNRRSILLLDEPETHFNPGWRSKFIKMLNESINAGSIKDNNNDNIQVHLLKDVILTSHSPFIVSDCMPENVIIFEKTANGILIAKKAMELGISTYGMSVNLITNRIFKNKETIGKHSLEKLAKYKERFNNKEQVETLIEELNEELGDSIEKILLIKEMTDEKS